MRVRKWLLVVLLVTIGLPLAAGLVVRLRASARPAEPPGVDRAALRAEMALKRSRGEGVAVRTIADEEADRRRPGVDFVVEGDSATLTVFDETAGRSLGTFGTPLNRRLHDDPTPGIHTYRFAMDRGATLATVDVQPRTLTRVVIELTNVRNERSGLGSSTGYYQATVRVEQAQPAYAQ